MITLKSLKWGRCFSYGNDNFLTLDSSTLTQIIGANGAGKSSIPDIIQEVLYNKNSKGIKKSDIPNRHMDGSYDIELDFDIDAVSYKIQLSRGKATKLKLLRGSEDISSHTATNTFKTIESLLGLDFKVFSQIVYQNVHSSLSFLTATDTERKKFLIDLLDLTKYLDKHEIFKSLSKSLGTKKTELDTQVTTLNKWISDNNIEGMEALPTIKIEISMEEEENEWARLTAEIKNISEKNKIIEKNNFYREQLSKVDLVQYSEVPKERKSTDEETKLIGEHKAQHAAAKAVMTKIKGLNDQCPTCLQEIDSKFKETLLAENQAILDVSSTKAKELQSIIKDKKAVNTLIDAKERAQQEFESLYRSLDEELPEDFVVKDDLDIELASTRAAIAKKKKQVEDLIKENTRRERNNTKISLIEEQSAEIEAQLVGILNKLEETNLMVSRVEVLKKSFSPNGLVAYKIENLVKDLEDLVNEYLIELSDGRFSLLFAVEKDKLNVHIVDDGNTIDISALSSGELARVNTSTLLAIRQLMSNLSKSQINILFLDEVINVLDENGKERLVELLLKEENLNTFLVSHGWEHPLVSKVHVVKDKDLSRIENG